jgi:hypothetical protein
MTMLDRRTRYDGAAVDLEPTSFVDDVQALVEANGSTAARAALRFGAPPLTLDVARERVTFRLVGDRIVVDRRADAALVVTLDRHAFSDLVQDLASTFGIQMTGRAQVTRGDADHFLAWEVPLRCLLDGRPVYEPGSVDFRSPDGSSPLDLQRSFTSEDDPAEIGNFLAQVGYLHLRGVFSEEEMAAVSADLDAAVAAAQPDDGASWWATTTSGESYPARILGFNQASPSLRALLHDERYRAIGSFTDDRYVARDPDVGDSAEGLLKKVGVVQGISDVSWHKDCSMGGHSLHCCGLTVGISVTGAGPTNGELGAVAGSHRANIVPLGVVDLDLPRVPLTTGTGDVTVHCSCTLHMSRPPVSAERRVVYTGFGLAPRPGDKPLHVDAGRTREERAALSDYAGRGLAAVSERAGSFDL